MGNGRYSVLLLAGLLSQADVAACSRRKEHAVSTNRKFHVPDEYTVFLS
jgi:hypothetical protein